MKLLAFIFVIGTALAGYGQRNEFPIVSPKMTDVERSRLAAAQWTLTQAEELLRMAELQYAEIHGEILDAHKDDGGMDETPQEHDAETTETTDRAENLSAFIGNLGD